MPPMSGMPPPAPYTAAQQQGKQYTQRVSDSLHVTQKQTTGGSRPKKHPHSHLSHGTNLLLTTLEPKSEKQTAGSKSSHYSLFWMMGLQMPSSSFCWCSNSSTSASWLASSHSMTCMTHAQQQSRVSDQFSNPSMEFDCHNVMSGNSHR